MIEPVYSFGLLALELCPGQHLPSAQLTVAQSERLGSLLAEDLRPWIGPPSIRSRFCVRVGRCMPKSPA